MPELCVLDEDNCLSLDSITQAFHCGIKEEHSWALVYQSIVTLKEDLIQNKDNVSFVPSLQLYIRNDGTVHEKSWRSSSESIRSVPIEEVISSIGTAVYKALDYGTNEDEEVVIPSQLEEFFILLTQISSCDEGIEEVEESNSSICSEIIQKCETRMEDNHDFGKHYQNVCRALVAEAIELSTFLNQISIGTKELKKLKKVDNEEVESIQVHVWAHLWMKVMRQLRVGVSLKAVDKQEFRDRKRREYELTPFEMLLEDINSKRYSLKKVVSLPKQVEKDARTLILDFVRSRPPLKPVGERKLKPLPSTEPSLHEKLMQGIKESPNLRPSPKPFERKFDSFYVPKGKRYSPIDQMTAQESANVFQRFSFRNLSLRSTSGIVFVSKQSTPVTNTISREMTFWERFRQKLW